MEYTKQSLYATMTKPTIAGHATYAWIIYFLLLVPTANANISSSLRQRRLTFNNYNAAIMFISGSNIIIFMTQNLNSCPLFACMLLSSFAMRLKLISSRRRIIEAIAKFCYFAYAQQLSDSSAKNAFRAKQDINAVWLGYFKLLFPFHDLE
jgi:hypothetical protein